MAGRVRGRVSALSLPVEPGAAVEFRAFASRTPLLSLTAGRVLVTLTLPEHLRAGDVEFARRLAEQAAAYAVEVERLYRSGHRLPRPPHPRRPSSRRSAKGVAV